MCLLDNITEHLDVIRAFQLMLHRKRGRLGRCEYDGLATRHCVAASGAPNIMTSSANHNAALSAVQGTVNWLPKQAMATWPKT